MTVTVCQAICQVDEFHGAHTGPRPGVVQRRMRHSEEETNQLLLPSRARMQRRVAAVDQEGGFPVHSRQDGSEEIRCLRDLDDGKLDNAEVEALGARHHIGDVALQECWWRHVRVIHGKGGNRARQGAVRPAHGQDPGSRVLEGAIEREGHMPIRRVKRVPGAKMRKGSERPPVGAPDQRPWLTGPRRWSTTIGR